MQAKIREDWKQFVKKIRKKGNERLTFMIIPHNKATIFNVQLTKFNIFISFVAFAIVVGSSALASQLQQSMKGEVTELYDVNRAVYNEREQYVNGYHAMWARQVQVKDYLSALMSEAELENQIDKRLFKDDEQYNRAVEKLNLEILDAELKNKVNLTENSENSTLQVLNSLGQTLSSADAESLKYGDMVINFKKLHLELLQNIAMANELHNFLKERQNVQDSLPYFWPMGGGHFTSFYGPRLSPFGYARDFHSGIDLADEVGTPIYAAADGMVVSSGYFGGYGTAAKLQHRYGFVTLYAHMSALYVRSGQPVKKGQLIGRVGATGRVTGPHLHYEIRIYDRPIDPLPYLTSG
ncbi:MAG: M23 family metallopeptidase [Leptospiraceae bacterium]|nr:M23 family metallopeptidase [Leptospiraceae bacterium]